jgi:hypothetical protein
MPEERQMKDRFIIGDWSLVICYLKKYFCGSVRNAAFLQLLEYRGGMALVERAHER